MKNNELHYSSKRIYLGDSDVEVHDKDLYCPTDGTDNKPMLEYEFWVEDISRYKKAVVLIIHYIFLGSPEAGPFFIYDAFINEIAISRKKEDQGKDYRWEYEVCATSEMLPFVRKTIKSQLKKAGLDTHFSCRVDFMQAYVQKCQDEEHHILSVREMTKSSAEKYLPEVFPHEIQGLKQKDYAEMLGDAKKVVIYEVSPDGTTYDVYKRMRYAINSTVPKSKDVFYYLEAGDLMKAGLCNPDSSLLMSQMDRHFNVVKSVLGMNLEEAKRYTKAVVGVLIH